MPVQLVHVRSHLEHGMSGRYHPRNVYRKLAIHSRDEWRSALGGA